MMYGYYNMMDWGGLGLFFPILFFGLLIVSFFVLFRNNSCCGKEEHGKLEKTPLDILKERYAKGEIDKKEYEEKKKDLS